MDRHEQPESLQELPEGSAVMEHEPGSGIWLVPTPDRDYLPPAFMSREEAPTPKKDAEPQRIRHTGGIAEKAQES